MQSSLAVLAHVALLALVAPLALAVGCSDPASAPTDAPQASIDAPRGPDVTTPFPIDGTDLPGAPGSYKGLALGLTDTGSPTVTAVRGVIGVVCIGMSNSTQECSDYIAKLASTYAGQFSPEVRVVDCAVGGNAIERWNDPANDATLWTACLAQKIVAGNVAADQIRVIYHKAADQFTTVPGTMMAKPPYPDPGSDYFAFQANLTTFAGRLAQLMPSVQAVYTTSRSYGGYAMMASRGEPLSYEEGHALNQWLVTNATIGGVWQGWGPYIWAPDCADGTSGSGNCYVRADYVADGIHPAQGARDKISALIHARFLAHAWYAP